MRTVAFSHLAIVGAVASLMACAALAGVELPPGESGVLPNTTTLRFEVRCPADPTKPGIQELKIQNVGTADGTYTITAYGTPDRPQPPVMLLDENNQLVETLQGTAKAKAITVVRVQATPTTPSKLTGSLRVKVADAPEESVPVEVTTDGVDLTISPTIIDFGELRKTEDAVPQAIQISNTGSIPVQLDGFQLVDGQGATLAIDLPPGTTIPPKETRATNATFAKGDPGPPLEAKFQAVTRGLATCGQSPLVTLKGTRVNREVSVTPVVDFGDADCKSGPSEKTFTITNYGDLPVQFTITGLSANSKFALSSTQGSVDKAPFGETSTATITVTRGAFTEEVMPYGEDLQVAIQSGPTVYQPAKVALRARSVGAILQISPAAVAWGSTTYFALNRTVTVTNTGNKFVFLQHALVKPPGSPFAIDGPSTTAVFPKDATTNQHDPTLELSFGLADTDSYSATLTTTRQNAPTGFPESGIICNTISDVPVTGSRSNPQPGGG